MENIEGVKYWEERGLEDERNDWNEKTSDWIESYWKSRIHPHRQLILDSLDKFEFKSLLEIGCNCGPNLALIEKKFYIPDTRLYLNGIDLNRYAIFRAQEKLPNANLLIGNAENLPFASKSIDVILCDAVLMYVDRDKIERVIKEMERVAKKGFVLVEWKGKDKFGELDYFHWCRDYKKLLKDYGIKVKEIKITKEIWPLKNWSEKGYIYECRLPSQTSKKK